MGRPQPVVARTRMEGSARVVRLAADVGAVATLLGVLDTLLARPPLATLAWFEGLLTVCESHSWESWNCDGRQRLNFGSFRPTPPLQQLP
jgi:hypothetical protein